MHFLILISLIFTNCFCYQKRSTSEQQLVSVIVIYRHGESVPNKELPFDHNDTFKQWPRGPGQLLNEGKRGMYQLGKWFRVRYEDLIPEKYSEKDIYVRSTDTDRTIMSALTNLAGLYPPIDEDKWIQDLNWQPIPIHTLPKDQDALFGFKNCPHHDELLEELWESDHFLDIENQTQEIRQHIQEYLGVEVKNVKNIASVYGNWQLKERFLNFTPPEWSQEVFDQMYHWSTFHNSLDCYNEEMARLKIGLMLNEITQIFLSASLAHKKKKQHRKITIYSGHKSTISNILKALELFDYHIPNYQSSLLFELTHWNGNYFVSFFYKNNSDDSYPPSELTLNNCTFECPFPDFQRILEPIRMLPEDWDDECELKFLGIIPTHMNHDVMVACGTLILLLIILGLFAIWFACRGDKDSLDTSDNDSYLKQL